MPAPAPFRGRTGCARPSSLRRGDTFASCARYSTDEQNPRSIEDQVAYCKRFLATLGITDVEIEVIYDPEMSGELIFWPGIDQARDGIRNRRWDVIIVEDSSRLFRNEVACVELVGLAVDDEIRVIAINDEVDTAEEGWDDRLYEAARHHAITNRHTSKRIKRAHEALWDMGAAVGLLKPGYRRLPSRPATDRDPEEGPFFDELDPQWAPIVRDAYVRIAGGESTWLVARWLTDVGLPKTPNSTKTEWTQCNVIDLIRRPDYRGHQRLRLTVSRKEYRTGKRKAGRNDPDKVLVREMPELRIVEDWLWQKANDAIDAREHRRGVPSGRDHPLAGIPRDSRGPLSGLLVCGACGGKVVAEGRLEGGYRCGHARRGGCWNKATALRDKTHQYLAGAINGVMEALDVEIDRLIARAGEMLGDAGHRKNRRAELRQRDAELCQVLARLAEAVERADQPPEVLVVKIEAREAELARVRAEGEQLDTQDTQRALPTREEVCARIRELVRAVTEMDRSTRDELEGLVGQIRMVPFQQFGSHKVVLRAKFELRLSALLPLRTRVALAGLCDGPLADRFEKIPMIVDLFDPSTGPKYGLETVSLMDKFGRKPTRIALELGINKRQACIALDYGEALRAASLRDPFVELTEPPDAASRWRLRRYDDRNQQNAS